MISPTKGRSPGLREALRALAAPRRKPTDADRPPPSVLPGRKTKALPGQLVVGEHVAEEHGTQGE